MSHWSQLAFFLFLNAESLDTLNLIAAIVPFASVLASTYSIYQIVDLLEDRHALSMPERLLLLDVIRRYAQLISESQGISRDQQATCLNLLIAQLSIVSDQTECRALCEMIFRQMDQEA